MSYADDLAKLKRSVRAYAAGQRKNPPRMLSCCVCSASPAPMTRFGPRCERHRPGPPIGGGEE